MFRCLVFSLTRELFVGRLRAGFWLIKLEIPYSIRQNRVFGSEDGKGLCSSVYRVLRGSLFSFATLSPLCGRAVNHSLVGIRRYPDQPILELKNFLTMNKPSSPSVLVAGSGAVRAHPMRGGPCYLVTIDDQNLLFDCGRCTVHNLS